MKGSLSRGQELTVVFIESPSAALDSLESICLLVLSLCLPVDCSLSLSLFTSLFLSLSFSYANPLS